MKKYLFTALFLFFTVGLNAQCEYWTWANSYGGSGLDQVRAFATNDIGESVLCMDYYSSFEVAGDSLIYHSTGWSDGAIIKIDPNGAPQWGFGFGGSKWEGAFDVALDSKDNIYISGYSASDTVFLGNTTLITGNSDDRAILIKLDKDGNYLWHIFSNGNVTSEGIAINSKDEVILTGNFRDSLIIGGQSLPDGPNREVFVAKLDSNGTAIWLHSPTGCCSDIAKKVAVTKDDEIVICGNTISGDFMVGSLSTTIVGGTDAFAIKYSDGGTPMWASLFGGSGVDNGRDIMADSNGDIVVTGEFRNTMHFGTDSITSHGDIDIFAVRFDSAGNQLWASSGGNSGMVRNFYSTMDSDGNTYMGVDFKGTIEFSGQSFTSPSSQTTAAVAKLDTDGTIQWVRTSGGTSISNHGPIGCDSDNNVYWAFTHLGNSLGSHTLITNGIWDGAVGKLIEVDEAVASFSYGVSGAGLTVDLTNLSTGDSLSYEWSFGDGSTSTAADPNHTYTTDGSYTITLITSNGCSSDTTTQLISLVGTELADRLQGLSVFPNPTNGHLMIQLGDQNNEPLKVVIADLKGAVILTTSMIDRGTLDLSRFGKGVYLLQISSGSAVSHCKVVVY